MDKVSEKIDLACDNFNRAMEEMDKLDKLLCSMQNNCAKRDFADCIKRVDEIQSQMLAFKFKIIDALKAYQACSQLKTY